MITNANALISLRPQAEWVMTQDDPTTLVWVSSDAPPTAAEIGAEVVRLSTLGPADAPPRETDLLAYAAAKRWAVQTGGVTVGGIAIDTSDASRSMIADAVAYVQAAGVPSVEFKAASGWVTLGTAEVVAIGLAVGAHVQQCFAAERAVALAIDGRTITTTAEIDAWPWPASAP